MGFTYRRRTPLGPNVWINWSAGWPSLSVRVGRVIFNTKSLLSSVRLGKGFSWRDRD